MTEKCESICWDCPSRRGLARITGKIACKFWGTSPLGEEHIKEQRGDCSGAVPAKYVSYGRGPITTIDDDTVTSETVWHDTYVAVCPKEFNTPPEAPDEVKTAMRVNHLDVFTHERTTVRTQSREEYESWAADLRERWETAKARRVSEPTV